MRFHPTGAGPPQLSTISIQIDLNAPSRATRMIVAWTIAVGCEGHLTLQLTPIRKSFCFFFQKEALP